jgi:hypothetical protein
MNPEIARLASGEVCGPITIGRAHRQVSVLLGATDLYVWLSFDTLKKQLSHHSELSLDFYENLEWLLRHGEVEPDGRPDCVFITATTGDGQRSYAAKVKVVRRNSRLMLLSVHRVRPRDIRRMRRKAQKALAP